MQYLTYEQYTKIGGKLDETAFNRNIDRASIMIDVRTQSRLEAIEKTSQINKTLEYVCADLVDYISANTVEKSVTSKSQSAGGVSESESYAVKTADNYATDLERIFEPLCIIKTKNGISVLYKGAMS